MLLLQASSPDWPATRANDQPASGSAWKHPQHPAYSGGAPQRVRSRDFAGLTAVLKDLRIDGEFEADCTVPFWRLMVVLDEVGGRLSVRMADSPPEDPRQDVPHAMYLSPPHTPLQASANGLRYLRQLSLQFDYAALEALFQGRPPPIPTAPKLGFFDPQIYALARVFETACAGGADDYGDLLGDSPAFSVLSLLSNHLGVDPAAGGGGLTSPQLRRVTDYLQDHLADPVRPVELAKLLGMSRSRFCREFKVSTGLPPHAWLMSLRVRRARELMMSGGHALVDVALGTGFADQPHFTRVFTRFSGVTPGEWRRQWSA